jgi:hypothetical protein
MNLIDGKVAAGTAATFGSLMMEQITAAEPLMHTVNDWLTAGVAAITIIYTAIRIYKLLKSKEK